MLWTRFQVGGVWDALEKKVPFLLVEYFFGIAVLYVDWIELIFNTLWTIVQGFGGDFEKTTIQVLMRFSLVH
jgi:hypothetical protein